MQEEKNVNWKDANMEDVFRSFAKVYENQKKGIKIRPRLGDSMPLNYMRERQTLTFLFIRS